MPARRCDRRSPLTTCAPSPTRWRTSTFAAASPASSSSRCSAGWATRSRPGSAGSATGCGSTPRSAISSRGWPTWCAVCWRTPPTRASCSSSATGPWTSCSRLPCEREALQREGILAEREPPEPVSAFRNHPLLELRRPEVRRELLAALASLDAELPVHPSVLVGGEGEGGTDVVSTDPCRPEREVARLRWASEDEAAMALELAFHSSWPERGVEERAKTLERAAELAAGRRHRLAALIVREAGKPWEDADAEVCEAIDFMRFYALVARDLAEDLEQVPGERNELRLRPRG